MVKSKCCACLTDDFWEFALHLCSHMQDHNGQKYCKEFRNPSDQCNINAKYLSDQILAHIAQTEL